METVGVGALRAPFHVVDDVHVGRLGDLGLAARGEQDSNDGDGNDGADDDGHLIVTSFWLLLCLMWMSLIAHVVLPTRGWAR